MSPVEVPIETPALFLQAAERVLAGFAGAEDRRGNGCSFLLHHALDWRQSHVRRE